MYLYWILLFAAILSEVIATTCMKLSVGFTRWLPSTLMFVFYSASGIFITFTIKRIELSIAYAIWASLGVVLTTFIGIMLFKETIKTVKMISTVMIICGVLGLYPSQPTQTKNRFWGQFCPAKAAISRKTALKVRRPRGPNL